MISNSQEQLQLVQGGTAVSMTFLLKAVKDNAGYLTW
jgi:hypothetical protein